MKASQSNDRTRIKVYLCIAVLFVLAGASFVLPVKTWFVMLVDVLRSFGAWGLVLLALFYVLAAVLLIPGSVLTLGAGFIGASLWPDNLPLALAAATAAVSLGATAGAMAAFVLGRTIARDFAERRIAGSPRFAALDKAVAEKGLKMVLLVRLSPAFPYTLLNYGLGLTGVRFRDYFLGTFIGMLPGALMYVYIGATAQSIAAAAGDERTRTPMEYGLMLFGLVMTIIVVGYVTRIARRAFQASVPAETASAESEETSS